MASAQQFQTNVTLRFWGALTVLMGVTLVAVLVPWVGRDPTEIHIDQLLFPPFVLPSFWFGTDDLGRDLLSRIAGGAQLSLTIGFLTALVAVGVGCLFGIVAATCENHPQLKWVDTAMMRFVDILYSLPGLMIVILLAVFLEPIIKVAVTWVPLLGQFGLSKIISIVFALALFSWPDTARIIRGQTLALQQEAFVEAYQSLGGNWLSLVLRHYLPNLMGLILLTTTITIPRAILTETTLSFIGLGVEPPLSSWGTLVSDGWQLVRVAPHLLLIPTLFIFATMLALNVLGDCMRVYLQPKK